MHRGSFTAEFRDFSSSVSLRHDVWWWGVVCVESCDTDAPPRTDPTRAAARQAGQEDMWTGLMGQQGE